MANAYATLASGGIRNKPKAITKVVFPDGKTDDLGEPERKRAFTDGVAYEVTKILEQNVQAGTGTARQIGCPAAGKTGTTDNFNDAWFVGYTPKLATLGVGRLPERPGRDAQRARDQRGRRHLPRRDLARLHDGRPRTTTAATSRSRPSPPTFSPFFGKYATTGRSGSGQLLRAARLRRTTGTGDNSAGGEDYKGYDPRLYESPPQGAPDTSPGRTRRARAGRRPERAAAPTRRTSTRRSRLSRGLALSSSALGPCATTVAT